MRLAVKDEGKKASLLLGHLKPAFQIQENLINCNGDTGREVADQSTSIVRLVS